MELPKKKRTKKIEAEIGSEPKIIKEDEAIKIKKFYTQEEAFIQAIIDLSEEVNNAFFRTPFNRCPDCNKGVNEIMVHYIEPNKIGNLKGFNATIGDVISWSSNTYKGLAIVKAKNNGVFELNLSPFLKSIKEPGIVEKILIPSKYLNTLNDMANYLLESNFADDVKKIGNGEYPSAITF